MDHEISSIYAKNKIKHQMTYFDFSKKSFDIFWHLMTFFYLKMTFLGYWVFLMFFDILCEFFWRFLILHDIFWHLALVFPKFFVWSFLTFYCQKKGRRKRYFWQFLTFKKTFTRPVDVFWQKMSNNVNWACKNLKNGRFWHYFDIPGSSSEVVGSYHCENTQPK